MLRFPTELRMKVLLLRIFVRTFWMELFVAVRLTSIPNVRFLISESFREIIMEIVWIDFWIDAFVKVS